MNIMYSIKGDTLTSIANAIRSKTKKEDSLKPDEMAIEIASIPGEEHEDTPLTIVENGVYEPPQNTRYTPITVNVPGEVYEDVPLSIVENGVYEPPQNTRYTPITVNVPGEVYEDVPLSIAKNGVYETPEKTRYTPITVDIPKPTLKAPTISINVATGRLLVFDSDSNGQLVSKYLLYVNDEYIGSFTEKSIALNDFFVISEDAIIKVKCAGDEFFNESDFSNIIEYDFVKNGTPCLEYSGGGFVGIGTATADVLYVASVANGVTITAVSLQKPFENKTFIFPDTITSQYASFSYSKNCTFVYGANIAQFNGYGSYRGAVDLIHDFRKTKQVPVINGNSFEKDKETSIIIVPDNLYDEWIIATNWSARAKDIVRASDYNAPPGESSTVGGVPLTITQNGVVNAPAGVRYNPITVEVIQPKPTLNAPEIYASAGTGNLIVNDYVNGIFTSEYLLYVDGVERATYTEKAIPMQEYIVTGEEQLQIKCKNDTFFNESELSNAITWNFAINGTPGLTYDGIGVTGIGTATDTTIYVASIVNSTKITTVSGYAFQNKSNLTIVLPDTVTQFAGQALTGLANSTIIFGRYFSMASKYSMLAYNIIYDFSKATKIPTLDAYATSSSYPPNKIIVPDELYEAWVVATNWSKYASIVIRVSEWIAQGGETV